MTKQRNKLTIRGLLFTLVILMGALGRVPLTASAEADLDVQITGADGTPASVTLEDADGDGYYEIGTADELYAFAAAVNGGNGAINGELTADIEVNKSVLASDGSLNGDGSNFRVWTQIGTGAYRFTGTFDGAGHIISGLYFNDYNTDYVGLFGYVSTDGRVQKVGVTDFYFNGDFYVGGIAGINYGTIINCYTTGTVKGTRYVGGVVGYNSNTVASCYSAGNNYGIAQYNVGGIVGYNSGSNSKVQNSFFNSDKVLYSGKAVGVDDSDETLGTVDNVDGKDTAAFASGEVAYLLNGDQTELVFKQTLGTDAAPNFTGESVYRAYIGCAGGTVYSNDEALKDINEEHLYNNLICAFCNKYESAIQNADGYYEIDNASKLFWFAEKVNDGDTGINGKLTADIVVNESVLADGSLNGDVSNFLAWKPIGTSNAGFTGTFDGAGHTISGLYFNDRNTSYVGLFGVVGTGGTIEKVGVTDSYFYGKEYIGGIAGQNGGTIRNCYNSGVINGWGTGSTISDHYYIGGVVGNNTSTVENCYNVGSVVSYGSASYAGGLVGSGTVINSYSIEGAYSSNNTGGGGIGGGGGGGSDDAEDDTDSKTAEQFASGEVAYLLNGDQTELVFKQTLGTDTAPNFTGEPVYYLKKCSSDDEVYSNVNEVHNFVGDTCEDCGVGKTIVITMQANNEIGSWDGAAITIKGNGEVISENNTVDMYEELRTEEFTCIPCKTYSFYWKSGYDENCSFTISSGTKELFRCDNAVNLELNDEKMFFEYTLLGTHDFPVESRTCQYCNETCGVDFDHAEENGTCSICQATLCEVTAQLTNITSDGAAWAVVNEEYVARLTAEDGYELPETITVTIGGEAFTAYTFREGVLTIPAESVTGEITIAAEALVLAQYAIAINSTENGTVTADAETAAKGATVTLSITPATGYYLDSLTVVDENEVEVPVENNAFVMPEASVTVTAVFAKNYGDFVIEGASEGWNVTNNVLTFTQGGAYTVSLADGKTETSQVIVVAAEGVTLTLNQITINAPEGTYGDSWEGTDGTPGVCALTLNYNTTLVLAGENTLTGGNGGSYVGGYSIIGYAGGAGISASTYMVTVSGEGSLNAQGGNGADSDSVQGGNGGAGIDGSVTLNGGTITVLGGTAGQDDAGSGNGETGAGLTGTITVADGKVLKVTAGASEASAEEKTEYRGEQYAQFAVCVAAMAGESLSLKGDIGVNFYLKLDKDIDAENASVKFILPNGEEELEVSKVEFDNTRGAYKLSTAVAAAEMAETITVQVFTGDSNEAAEEFTYSVVDYARTIFEDQDTYAATVPLMQTMLNYGAMAQTYFDRNTEKPANAILDEYDGLSKELSDVDAEDLAQFDAIIPETGLPEGMAYAGTSLLLEAEVTLRHYFTLEKGTPKVSDGWNWVERNGKYYAEKTGIVAAELGTMQSLTIDDTWTMEYSPLSYVKKVLEAETETRAGAKNLMKALYYYNQAANTYFANQQ